MAAPPSPMRWMVPALVTVAVALALIGVLALVTKVDAHSWYTGQKSPRGGSCCGGQDCRPLTPDAIRLNDAGEIEVLMHGSWWPALDKRWFVETPPPDGSWHICYQPQARMPRCVFGGQGT